MRLVAVRARAPVISCTYIFAGGCYTTGLERLDASGRGVEVYVGQHYVSSWESMKGCIVLPMVVRCTELVIVNSSYAIQIEPINGIIQSLDHFSQLAKGILTGVLSL